MYNSIVISGLPGAGKSSLARELSEHLGWEIFSIGKIWRKRWESSSKSVPFEEYWKNISLQEQKSANEEARKTVSRGKVIGDFRYAICCKDLPALFIFVKADPEIRARRLAHTNSQIKSVLDSREKDELKIGKDIYGRSYDYRDEDNYDLVLDTGKLTLQEELQLVKKALNQ